MNTILYVDDERGNLNAFKLLYRRKFKVLTAASGQEALDVLDQEPVQLLITDQRMPQMTGVELLKIVKERRPDLKFILLTAYTDNETLKEAINEVGLYWYFNKPFDKDQMELAIRKGLEARKNELLVRENQARIQGVIENLIEGFYIAKLDGTLLSYNKEFIKIIGLDPDRDHTGLPLLDFWQRAADREKYLLELQEKGFVKNHIVYAQKADGREIITQLNARIVYNEEEQPDHIEGVFLDITEEYTLQKKIEKSRKKSREKILAYQQRLKDLVLELTLTEEIQRKNIATGLHDQVGQLLASARLQLAAIHEGMNTQEILFRLRDISNDCLKGIQAVRSAIFDLTFPQLHEIGLFAAAADWLDHLENKYQINTEIKGDDELYPLDENTRLLLFRSIRELLMNVVKHARASRVEIQIYNRKDHLEISVLDDGIGFSYNADNITQKTVGFGLFSILERINDIGGSMEVHPAPEKGSVVKLISPLRPFEDRKRGSSSVIHPEVDNL